MKSVPTIFVLYGNDDLKKDESLNSIIKRWLETETPDEMAKEVFYGNKLDFSDFQESYEMVSMFASRKIIIIKQFDDTSAEFQQKFMNIVRNDNPDTAVAISMKKLDKRSKISKFFKNNGQINECMLPFADKIPPWLSTRCSMKFNRRLSIKDAAYLCECIGDDLQELDWELNKLDVFLPPNQPITSEIIDEVVLPHRDMSFFDAQKYFGLGNITKSLITISGLLEQGEPGFRIAINLFFHFLKLLRIKKLMDDRVPPDEIAKGFKMHPFFFKKLRLMEQAGKRSIGEYKNILHKLAELELNFKRGKYPLKFETEMAITAIFTQ